jgi:GT2 family glycosyltransferase
VDGDCEVAAGWIDAAVAALDQDPSVAVVCGRRRERRRAASIYNRLCDMEWNTAPGWTDSCGGDAMMRASVLTAVGGYDSSLIAGEEPDLCHRIRERGHRVRRLDAEMTTHDAAMTRFGQWWKRTVRAGHAAAENHARHHAGIGTAATRRLRSSALWGGVLPGLVVAGVITGLCLGSLRAVLLVLAAGSALVAVQIVRIWRGRRRRGDPAGDAWLYAWFCMLGKVPELQGALTYARHRHAGVEGGLIEYKGAPSGSPGPASPSPGRPGSA